MVGGEIFTQNTPQQQDITGDLGATSIGLGNYNFDSHNAQRMACENASDCMGGGGSPSWSSRPFAWDEGDVQIAPGIYQIPLWVMLPKKEQVSNLLVVAAPSASHIGMSTLRMEPQFMIIGHAAGVVASLAAAQPGGLRGNVHSVPNTTIHTMLLADGQIMHGATPQPRPPPPPSPPAPRVPTLGPNQWLAIDSFFSFQTDAGVTTMTVSSLPHGKRSTYLKKSERNSAQLPPSELKRVTKGEKFTLSVKPMPVEGGYWVVTLQA